MPHNEENTAKICPHCGIDKEIQPSRESGCNHVHYPEFCEICSERENPKADRPKYSENYVKSQRLEAVREFKEEIMREEDSIWNTPPNQKTRLLKFVPSEHIENVFNSLYGTH